MKRIATIKRLLIGLAMLAALVAARSLAAAYPHVEMVEHRFGGDHFVAGRSVDVRQPVAGDLLAAAGELRIEAPIAGDVMLAGGQMRLSGRTERSVLVAGGEFTLNGGVGRNLRAAGGRIHLAPEGGVAGNATLAGGQIEIDGTVVGSVQAVGGRIRINGEVTGDVEATGGRIVLGPNARIGGRLRYQSQEPLERDPAARIEGGLEALEPRGGWPVPATVERQFGGSGSWLWTIGLTLIATAWVGAAPNLSTRIGAEARSRPAVCMLAGLAVLACTPLAIVLLAMTIIGIPLALAAMSLFPLFLLVGYVVPPVALGDYALARWRPEQAGRRLARVVGAATAIALLALASVVPLLGAMMVIATLLTGTGAIALHLMSWRSHGTAPAATVAAIPMG